MQKHPVQRGRPAGATTFDAELAKAFGTTVRALRSERGISQEALANLAGIECSHMGKIERGEHMPMLAIFFKIAGALGCSAAALMGAVEDVVDRFDRMGDANQRRNGYGPEMPAVKRQRFGPAQQE